MKDRPIYSAACPCCACTLVVLASANGHRLAPYAWTCVHCGFVMMGLAVQLDAVVGITPRVESLKNERMLAWPFRERQMTCLEVYESTKVRA